MDDLTEKVVDVVKQHLFKVREAGPTNLIALCPFHDDRSPSFAINIQNGLWLCYACGESGNFRSFLLKLGMAPDFVQRNFGHTIKRLKENAPPPPDPTKPGYIAEPLKHVPESLLGIFHRCPMKLVEEGFSKATLKQFGIGVDLVHKRITFPLRDLVGNLVGISGRALDEGNTKRYKVYDTEYEQWELPKYHTEKSLLLWNAHKLLPEFDGASGTRLVIVEGFKACMWLHQAGITNVAALMTKTMSWAQLQIIQRLSNAYTLMLDNDDPGTDGTVKICRELEKTARDIRIVEYAERQPTDVPLDEIPELVESATDYMEMVLG